MDIMLTRILSLVPKKPDGSFEHGALKAFAQSIGLKSGNLISDWINGRSASYKNYIYKISSVYGVSVEWLKGDTDEKWPSTEAGERPMNEYETKILNAVRSVPVEYQDVLLNMILSVAQTLKESPGLPLSDLLRQE